MTGETIRRVLYPAREDGWILLETDRGFYELRRGGYAPAALVDPSGYEANECPDGLVVDRIYTDGHDLYIILSTGHVLIHGFSIIDSEGVVHPGVELIPPEVFREDYGAKFPEEDPDMRKLE